MIVRSVHLQVDHVVSAIGRTFKEPRTIPKKPASDQSSDPKPARPRVARKPKPTSASASGNGNSHGTSAALQPSSEPSYDEIAEAAYQRYLRRGGSHGDDFGDWLAAERDLRTRLGK